MYAGKIEVCDFSDKIIHFIEKNELVNDYGNLICDYIEELFLMGYPVLDIDLEKQVYVFFHYIVIYGDILQVYGEEEFIKMIVQEEINKN